MRWDFSGIQHSEPCIEYYISRLCVFGTGVLPKILAQQRLCRIVYQTRDLDDGRPPSPNLTHYPRAVLGTRVENLRRVRRSSVEKVRVTRRSLPVPSRTFERRAAAMGKFRGFCLGRKATLSVRACLKCVVERRLSVDWAGFQRRNKGKERGDLGGSVESYATTGEKKEN